jgi:hypothetical protein
MENEKALKDSRLSEFNQKIKHKNP